MSVCYTVLFLLTASIFCFLAFRERILSCFTRHSQKSGLRQSSSEFFEKNGAGAPLICFSSKTVDDFLSNDCDITYKEFRTPFESSLKKILGSYASNDDKVDGCSSSSQSRNYTPTLAQDDDDDPDDLA